MILLDILADREIQTIPTKYDLVDHTENIRPQRNSPILHHGRKLGKFSTGTEKSNQM